jgi:hypothetical protein
MKNLPLILIASVLIFGSRYEGSTTSAVVLSGGIIKSTHIEPADQKYKRKNCPICKGTGKYLSGDGIKMVDCGYCEPDKKEEKVAKPEPQKIIRHSPIILNNIPKCNDSNCRVQ